MSNVNEKEDREAMDRCWVDFLEGEVDEALGEDLINLMRLSKSSRENVDNLMWTRELIKSIDPAHEEHLNKWDAKKSLNNIMNEITKPSEETIQIPYPK